MTTRCHKTSYKCFYSTILCFSIFRDGLRGSVPRVSYAINSLARRDGVASHAVRVGNAAETSQQGNRFRLEPLVHSHAFSVSTLLSLECPVLQPTAIITSPHLSSTRDHRLFEDNKLIYNNAQAQI